MVASVFHISAIVVSKDMYHGDYHCFFIIAVR